ncbi:nuclear transport factor 2 family protein [Aquimarina sp. 2201CG14-23]|uniref:nuclear transport factor 2 family protein n=1 Tax=Aquimarina mycalae TaxID=3040073 RepID=UPI0024780F24|nr:nuclear transport factor 2 family protein [Aquimarina sp. 2201CG14-23]MDH7445770.1 nuclear transport factor 2 family protein [Aquimarina sp. 2201CG14-23]
MTKIEVAEHYLSFLEKGEVDKVIALFTDNGIVESPLYGVLPAREFYRVLAEDTNASELQLDGVFSENNSNRISVLFKYIWTLKNNTKVEFKVVDILEFSSENKIEKLIIIYDTIEARKILAASKS